MMLRLQVSLYVRWFRAIYARRFRRFGRNTALIFPAGVDGMPNIALGDDVYIAYKTYLAALPHTGHADCLLQIGSGTRIGRFNHLYATRRVVLGANVLTANNVYIADNSHGYQNPDLPILHQPIVQNGDVEIGDGTWLGHNACVLGVRVGRHCVIGANAVVTHDIPDYCVAVGAPAIVIRRYDAERRSWLATRPDGSFEPTAADQPAPTPPAP